MKPIIPKEIKAPALNQRQIEELTNIVFTRNGAGPL